MRILSRLAERWEIAPGMMASQSFDDRLATLNLRRVELVCLLAIANDLIEIALGFPPLPFVAEIVYAALAIPVAIWLARVASVQVQRFAAILFIIIAFFSTDWAIYVLAREGYIPAGYLTRVLCIALLFVMPVRTWVMILSIAFLGFCATVAIAQGAISNRFIAIVNAVIVSAIALVAAGLIHGSRRADHAQQLQIERQNQQLTERNDHLDQLMAITAHDLRSPLYGLRNLLDLASRQAEAEPRLAVRAMRDGIYSLNAMIALVTRLLEAHAAEHGPLDSFAVEDVRDCLREAARRAGPLADGQGITIALELPDAPVLARIERGALEQILDNLLNNAIRFSPPDGIVLLRAFAGEAGAAIEVQDSGPGIAEDLRAVLFRKFMSHPARRGASRPRGLGLFIAATLTARLGATLQYEPAEGGGARFRLSLPIL